MVLWAESAVNILLALCLLQITESVRQWSRHPRHVIPPPTPSRPTLPPEFDSLMPVNVTVTATKTAMLSCIVHNLGNNSVSWIRHRDLHILSVGPVTYTSDSRYQVVPQDTSDDWMLRIRYTHPRDSGQYDCQVSSTPPIARTTYLTVIVFPNQDSVEPWGSLSACQGFLQEPEARILRSPEMHVGIGSLINLTCIVPYSPETLEYLHWYHKDKIVRGDGTGVTVETHLGERSISHLVISVATAEDAGIYTCSPAHSKEGQITVYVLTDEYPAAMQGGSSVTWVSRHYWACLFLCSASCLTTSGGRPWLLNTLLSVVGLSSLLQYLCVK